MRISGKLIRTAAAFFRDKASIPLEHGLRLDSLGADRVFWGEMGTGNDIILKHFSRLQRISGANVLFQGVGRGKEVLDFLPYKPHILIGCDLLNNFEDRPKIEEICLRQRVLVYFIQGDVQRAAFTHSAFDIAASFAAYEHIGDLNSALSETRRVLKKGGMVISSLGPLYYCFGGDHFSGAGGLQHGYNHLTMSPEQYAEYFNSYSYMLGEERENYYRDIFTNHLFNHLKFQDYVRIFTKYFTVEYLAIKVCPNALLFRRRFPDKFLELQQRYGLQAYDLLIKGIIVFMRG